MARRIRIRPVALRSVLAGRSATTARTLKTVKGMTLVSVHHEMDKIAKRLKSLRTAAAPEVRFEIDARVKFLSDVKAHTNCNLIWNPK